MGLKKLAAKVNEYNERVENGEVRKIEPADVAKVLEKLRMKSVELEDAIASATSPDKKARLDKKLGIARAHVKRGEWLLEQLEQAGTEGAPTPQL